MKDYDVVIIGGGAVGSACARELSRYELRMAVLEKNLDVCCETSGRNSGVVHGGFAYDEGTLKAELCVEGNRGFQKLAEELNFPFYRTGKLLVGNTEEDRKSLEKTMEIGKHNGVTDLVMLDKEEFHKLVPKAVGEFAMYSPSSGITDPFLYTVALAENACENGVSYYFDHEVTKITREDRFWMIEAGGETFRSRWVINSAGLGCGKISEMLGIHGYRIIGSKGDYIILDQRTGPLLPMPVYPVPSNTYMGIHVTPTAHGNVIVGPNAELVDRFDYYGVSQKNIEYLAEDASHLWPCIQKKDYIRNYSGILPKWVDENGKIQDFKIEIRDEIAPCAVNLIGIESPGLTAAVPIARRVAKLMQEREPLRKRPDFQPTRKGIRRFADQTAEEQARMIDEDPNYGELVCRCEKVTKAEILQAIHNPLGVHTVTGIKYRTRCMMGRCQGGYCQMRIVRMLEEELGWKETQILYMRKGSEMFTGKVRE